MSAWGQFLTILTLPDNIPIVIMMVAVMYFTWLGFRQAIRNDFLDREGRSEEILKEMQE